MYIYIYLYLLSCFLLPGAAASVLELSAFKPCRHARDRKSGFEQARMVGGGEDNKKVAAKQQM